MIRVVIADDHSLVREGLRGLLNRYSDIQIVAEVDDGLTAFDVVQELLPDILITSISLPHLDGLQHLERIRNLHLPTRVIMLSSQTDELTVRQAYKAGARGYLVKKVSTDEVMMAIRAVHRGETYVSSAISGFFITDFINAKHETLIDTLSLREREVLQLVAEGYSAGDIAERLSISPRTVEKHRASLMEKLGVNNSASLIRAAIKHHLIAVDGV